MTDAAPATCWTPWSRDRFFWPTAPTTATRCARASTNAARGPTSSPCRDARIDRLSVHSSIATGNLVERFFNKIKHYRAVATRYDKRAENFLAGVKLASIRIWMRFNESMT
jgi:transposase